MEISKDELNYLLKNARNTGFAIAFIACFCLAIVGGLFTLYIYKSFEPSIATITQTQDGMLNNMELNNEATPNNQN